MKKSSKALLLSALIFPGAGYFVAKKPMLAVSCIALVLALLSYMVYFLSGLIQPLLHQIQAGRLSSDPLAIQQALETLLIKADPFVFNVCSIMIFLVWLLSSLDGYRRTRSL